MILPSRTVKTERSGAAGGTRGPDSSTVPLGLLLAMLIAVSLFAARPANARKFTVNYRGDTTDDASGDGYYDAGLGLCSLRAAIEESNAFEGKVDNGHGHQPERQYVGVRGWPDLL